MSASLNRKLVRDLRHSWVQFVAVAAIIVVGLSLFNGLTIAYQNLRYSYQHSYNELAFADFTIRVNSAPREVVEMIQSMKGVKTVTGRINYDVILSKTPPGVEEEEGTRPITARIISLPVLERPTVNNVLVLQGAYLAGDVENGALLERSFAEYHKIKLNDEIYPVVKGVKMSFEVLGVVSSAEYIWPARSEGDFTPPGRDFAIVYIPQSTAESIFSMPDQINEICVIVRNHEVREKVIEDTKKLLRFYGIQEVVKQEDQPSNRILQADLQANDQLSVLFPVMFLTVATLTTYVLLTRLVNQQRSQIGVMRALGCPRRRIIQHYLTFPLIVGSVGAIIAVVIGHYIVQVIVESYFIILRIPFYVTDAAKNNQTILSGIIMGLVFSAISGVLPAYSAAKIMPAESMRAPPPAAGRTLLIERILPGLRNMSSIWKIPLRNIFRVRRRTIYTAAGVTASISMILVSVAFFDTMDHAMNIQFNDIQHYNTKVYFNEPRPVEIVSELKVWNGVLDAEPSLEVPVNLQYAGKNQSTVLIGLLPNTQMMTLYSLDDNKPITVNNQGLLLSTGLRNKLKISESNYLKLEFTSAFLQPKTPIETPLRMRVSGIVSLSLGAMGFASLSKLQEILGITGYVTGVMMKVEPQYIDHVKTELYKLSGVSFVEVNTEIRKDVDELLASFNTFTAIQVAAAIAMSFAVIFNMVTVNVLERSREIATMRTLGASLRRIAAMITIENLIVALLGIIPGILFGQQLSAYFMSLYSTDVFTLKLTIYPRTYSMIIGGIIGLALVSEIPSLRHVGKMELPKVTKEQSL